MDENNQKHYTWAEIAKATEELEFGIFANNREEAVRKCPQDKKLLGALMNVSRKLDALTKATMYANVDKYKQFDEWSLKQQEKIYAAADALVRRREEKHGPCPKQVRRQLIKDTVYTPCDLLHCPPALHSCYPFIWSMPKCKLPKCLETKYILHGKSKKRREEYQKWMKRRPRKNPLP